MRKSFLIAIVKERLNSLNISHSYCKISSAKLLEITFSFGIICRTSSQRGHNRHGPKRGGCCAPFGEWVGSCLPPLLGRGSWVPIEHNVAWAEVYMHPDPYSHFATTDMGRKLGGLCPFGEGKLGPHLTQCGQCRGLPACQVSS